jgi:hypothetical protein
VDLVVFALQYPEVVAAGQVERLVLTTAVVAHTVVVEQ